MDIKQLQECSMHALLLMLWWGRGAHLSIGDEFVQASKGAGFAVLDAHACPAAARSCFPDAARCLFIF